MLFLKRDIITLKELKFMYLRKIDYEILKMMREKAKDENNPYYRKG